MLRCTTRYFLPRRDRVKILVLRAAHEAARVHHTARRHGGVGDNIPHVTSWVRVYGVFLSMGPLDQWRSADKRDRRKIGDLRYTVVFG